MVKDVGKERKVGGAVTGGRILRMGIGNWLDESWFHCARRPDHRAEEDYDEGVLVLINPVLVLHLLWFLIRRGRMIRSGRDFIF